MSGMAVSSSTGPKPLGAMVAWARGVLAAAGVEHAAQEAMWLAEHALGVPSHAILAGDRLVTQEERTHVETLVARRAAREPLQYLLGTQEFCGLEFAVSPAALIPRPETELLVQEVIRGGAGRDGAVLVDVGTGSGCLAITLATILDRATIIATDHSSEALMLAGRNAQRHSVERRIEWLEGDLLAPVRARLPEGSVDVILSNPPYIAEEDWAGLQPEVRLFEPRMALVAGPKGTEVHERLLHDAHPLLASQGVLLLEVGQGQAPAVRRLAEALGGYEEAHTACDEAGIERVVILQKRG